MLRPERATEETLQLLLNEAIRTRQALQQLIGIQESLLQVQLQNNVALRRLAGMNNNTGEVPVIRPH